MKLTGFHNNHTVSLGNNDCTVRALATVTKKDYVEIMLVLDAAGRHSRRSGFPIYDWLKSNGHTVLGHWFEPALLDSRGTFLIGNQGHVWAIVNGVMHDSWGEGKGRRYKYCYRVHKLCDSEAAPTKHEQQAQALISATLQD